LQTKEGTFHVPKMLNATITDLTVVAVDNINSFAAMVEQDPTGIYQALLLMLSSFTSLHVQVSMHHNPSVANQYYTLYQDKVVIMTCPTIATNATYRLIYMASKGDQLNYPVPISIPAGDFKVNIITLAI
jgi:hypothetical protein